MKLMQKKRSVGVVLMLMTWIGTFQGLSPTRAEAQGTAASFQLEDATSVDDAITQIRTTLEAQGATIVATIDHAAAAMGVGLELRPTTVLLFSNPRLDTQLLQRSQTTGIDLPQKFLVWQDAAGAIRLSFNTPSYLSQRHDITWRDRLLEQMREVLEQFDDDTGLLTLESTLGVDNTVTTLQTALQERGFAVRPVIDHQAIAASVHRRVRPTQVLIFGNPTAGTQLMQNQQTMGIDLPLKFLVWENRARQVFLTYNDIHFLARRHGVEGLDDLLTTIATTLRTVAEIGAGISPGNS
jgi:uncharacterized protein (DUF302 family)